MDIARLDRGLLIAGGGGLLLLISLFLPWYGVSASLGPGAPSVSVSASAWEAFSLIDLLLFLVAAVAVAAAALSAAGRLPALPLPLGQIVLVAGVIALVLVLFRLIDAPGDTGGLAGVDIGRKIGPFLALVAAVAIAFGGSQTSAAPAPATRAR